MVIFNSYVKLPEGILYVISCMSRCISDSLSLTHLGHGTGSSCTTFTGLTAGSTKRAQKNMIRFWWIADWHQMAPGYTRSSQTRKTLMRILFLWIVNDCNISCLAVGDFMLYHNNTNHLFRWDVTSNFRISSHGCAANSRSVQPGWSSRRRKANHFFKTSFGSNLKDLWKGEQWVRP